MSNSDNVTSETVSNETAVLEVSGLEILPEGSKLPEIISKVNEVIQKVNSIKVRDRGPKSSRSMTQEDATKVQKGGKLEKLSHMEAAKELGLSYGQIYSCRNGYTFQNRS